MGRFVCESPRPPQADSPGTSPPIPQIRGPGGGETLELSHTHFKQILQVLVHLSPRSMGQGGGNLGAQPRPPQADTPGTSPPFPRSVGQGGGATLELSHAHLKQILQVQVHLSPRSVGPGAGQPWSSVTPLKQIQQVLAHLSPRSVGQGAGQPWSSATPTSSRYSRY